MIEVRIEPDEFDSSLYQIVVQKQGYPASIGFVEGLGSTEGLGHDYNDVYKIAQEVARETKESNKNELVVIK